MGISSVSDIRPAANSAHLILLRATLFEAFPPLLRMKKVQLNFMVMNIRYAYWRVLLKASVKLDIIITFTNEKNISFSGNLFLNFIKVFQSSLHLSK